MKHVYRGIIVLFVFAISLGFMSRNIKEVEIDLNTTIDMGEADFPLITIKSGENKINLLHGYSRKLDTSAVRESLTPIDLEKTIELFIEEKTSIVKRIKYELTEVNSNEIIDSGTIYALDKTNDQKSAKIKFKTNFTIGREYAVKITAVTDSSRKIHYYTRVKYYEDSTHLKEKMDFIKEIHETALSKDPEGKLSSYLESSSLADNTSLAEVTLQSSHTLVCFGELNIEVVSDIIPTIKEMNMETASVQFVYRAKAVTGSGEELFTIKEFYRVRYTKERIYLLAYHRTMEADFNIELASLKKNELKIGITKDTEFDYIVNNTKLSFVRNRELWYYNLAENTAIKVFAFLNNKEDYIREGFDQHNIRILNMDEEGNIDFVVYGYMNRGDYEGRVGVVLYKFFSSEKRIEEQVYIPIQVPYQVLKFDLDAFNYVSQRDVYYFSINNIIYAYNIPAKKLTMLTNGVSADSFLLSKEGEFIAWQDSAVSSKSKNINILDLETEQQYTISAGKKECIRILGGTNSNLIYGLGNISDITEDEEGNFISPLYKVYVSDKKGNILKEHSEKGIYVTKAVIKDNIIELEQISKEGNEIKPMPSGHLINIVTENSNSIGMTTRTTELTLKEYYVSMPKGFVMKEIPKVQKTVNTIITEDTALYLDESEISIEKYYVYALGDVIDAYSNIADAIILADKTMGAVLDQSNRTVWERGGKYNHNSIEGIEMIQTRQGIDSIGACTAMLLKTAMVDVNPEDVSYKNTSIYNLLKENMDKKPISLIGCSLDSVLYYVSSNCPVIAMKSEQQAVLLVGYDEYYVTIIDPVSGTKSSMLLSKAEELFKEAGNIFISYLQ